MLKETSTPSEGVKPAAARRARQRSSTSQRRTRTAGELQAAERHTWIAEAAYFKAERRGFAPGHDWQDWFEAERELERLSSAGAPARRRS